MAIVIHTRHIFHFVTLANRHFDDRIPPFTDFSKTSNDLVLSPATVWVSFDPLSPILVSIDQ